MTSACLVHCLTSLKILAELWCHPGTFSSTCLWLLFLECPPNLILWVRKLLLPLSFVSRVSRVSFRVDERLKWNQLKSSGLDKDCQNDWKCVSCVEAAPSSTCLTKAKDQVNIDPLNIYFDACLFKDRGLTKPSCYLPMYVINVYISWANNSSYCRLLFKVVSPHTFCIAFSL